MKKIIILGILALIAVPSVIFASVSPFYKECLQRSYTVEDINSNSDAVAYCVFPDKTKCPIKEFNAGTCGQSFMTKNYCVKVGEMVWDENKCCAGSKAFLPEGVVGQARCQIPLPIDRSQKDWNKDIEDWNKAFGRNQTASSSSIENRLENRENNIERIRERIASTTASTSVKKMEKLNERFQKQSEQMTKLRERLAEKELKVISVLQKIADKITDRISILKAKGLNMADASAKLAEASAKIAEMTTEAAKMTTLVETTITEENKTQLFTDIRTAQNKVKTLARTTHALLVDTIKEITKVQSKKTTTSTTTTTN